MWRSSGGGWLRRYLRVRKDVYAFQWITPDRHQCSPLSIFDFSCHDDYVDAFRIDKDKEGWRLSDDSVIGGFSRASARIMLNDSDVIGNEDDNEKEAEALDEESFAGQSPFLRWQGNLDTRVGLNSRVQRSGFCSLRSPEFTFGGANLQGLWNALEIEHRASTPRVFTVNLRVASTSNDIYQCSMPVQESPTKSILHFDQFSPKGREYSRALDDNVSIESIALTLMDGKDGEFCLDLTRIRAVNVLSNGTVWEPRDSSIGSD